MVYVFIFIFLIGGAMMLAMSVSLVRKGIQSKSWPTAKGIILKSGLKTTESWNQIDVAKIRLLYEYEVNGVKHQCTKIDFSGTRKAAVFQRIALLGLTEGKEVTVYYDPEHHHRAILEPGLKFKYLTSGFLALAAIAFCVLGIVAEFSD